MLGEGALKPVVKRERDHAKVRAQGIEVPTHFVYQRKKGLFKELFTEI